jgi:hypothetical protein
MLCDTSIIPTLCLSIYGYNLSITFSPIVHLCYPPCTCIDPFRHVTRAVPLRHLRTRYLLWLFIGVLEPNRRHDRQHRDTIHHQYHADP